jgi:hypothetical protein
MIAEFLGRGGISQVSLKSVCDHAETKEPVSGGDVDEIEQKFE